MFWRKPAPAPYNSYRYVAVLEIELLNEELYGKRNFRFKLADGTTEDWSFEAADWRAWQESILKGGVVVNA